MCDIVQTNHLSDVFIFVGWVYNHERRLVLGVQNLREAYCEVLGVALQSQETLESDIVANFFLVHQQKIGYINPLARAF